MDDYTDYTSWKIMKWSFHGTEVVGDDSSRQPNLGGNHHQQTPQTFGYKKVTFFFQKPPENHPSKTMTCNSLTFFSLLSMCNLRFNHRVFPAFPFLDYHLLLRIGCMSCPIPQLELHKFLPFFVGFPELCSLITQCPVVDFKPMSKLICGDPSGHIIQHR